MDIDCFGRKSKHHQMETENGENVIAAEAAAKEEEEEEKPMQCPFKKMKMDKESDSQRGEALVSVTSLENPKDLRNGGDDGEKLTSDVDGEEGEPDADGDSENGECESD